MLGTIVDTLLGLMLMFAVLGLVNTSLVEIVPRILAVVGRMTPGGVLGLIWNRGDHLCSTLGAMLDGVRSRADPGPTTAALLSHPLVKALGERPSSIEPRTFAAALVDLVANRADPWRALIFREAARGGPDAVGALQNGLPEGWAVLRVQLQRAMETAPGVAGEAHSQYALRLLQAVSGPGLRETLLDNVGVDRIERLVELVTALPQALGSVAEQPQQFLRESFGLAAGTQITAPAIAQALGLTGELASIATASEAKRGRAEAALAGFRRKIEEWCALSGRIEAGAIETFDQIEQALLGLPASAAHLQSTLLVLLARARLGVTAGTTAYAAFVKELETHYAEAMERLIGVFKRQARKIGLITAAFLCVAVNADAIHVVRTLSKDPEKAMKAAEAARLVSGKAAAATDKGQPIALHEVLPAPSVECKDVAQRVAKIEAQHAAKAEYDKKLEAKKAYDALSEAGKVGQKDPGAPGDPPAEPARPTMEEMKQFVACEVNQAAAARDYLTTYLPIGWPAEGEFRDEILKRGALAWLFGILISIFAVSLGGEFWFRTMQDVIRLAGPKGGATKPATSAG